MLAYVECRYCWILSEGNVNIHRIGFVWHLNYMWWLISSVGTVNIPRVDFVHLLIDIVVANVVCPGFVYILTGIWWLKISKDI